MTYQVIVIRRARKALDSLPRKERLRIGAAIDLLADNPRPPNSLALQGEPGTWRVRIGNYRIIYTIHDGRLVVEVIRVGHRRDVYR